MVSHKEYITLAFIFFNNCQVRIYASGRLTLIFHPFLVSHDQVHSTPHGFVLVLTVTLTTTYTCLIWPCLDPVLESLRRILPNFDAKPENLRSGSPLGAFGLFSGTCACLRARDTCLGCFDDIEALGSLSQGHSDIHLGPNINHRAPHQTHFFLHIPQPSRRQDLSSTDRESLPVPVSILVCHRRLQRKGSSCFSSLLQT